MSEGSRETPRDANGAALAPLPWAVEQQLLGVGVRIERRPSRHLRHLPALAEATTALARGAEEAAENLVTARLSALRRRLWRSPFWVERLRRRGGSPDDLTSLRDLEHFPTLDRDEYARSWTGMPDLDGDPELHIATSSGTTGQALLAVRSGYDGLHMWAVLRFWIQRLGLALPERPRLVLLCALPGGLEYSVRAPVFLGGALHRVSTVRPEPLGRLRRARAAVLSSDPAGLHWLLGQDDPPRPRLVLSSAQHLTLSLRDEVTRRLGTPVLNYFATTETGPLAWECLREPGRFHVLHPDVWVESLKGALAVTRLRDSPLPLVRYLTADRGEVIDGTCACGVKGRSILGFTGRHPCTFTTPDGRPVDAWALSWLFKDLPLVRFQLSQAGAQSFTLVLDPHVSMDLALLAVRLRRTLVRLGFPRPGLTIERAALPLVAKPSPFVPLRP